MGFIDSPPTGGGVDVDTVNQLVQDAVNSVLPDAVTTAIADSDAILPADVPGLITAYNIVTLGYMNRQASVLVEAGQTEGSTEIETNSIILGIYPVGNQDQFIASVSPNGTTLTVTLTAPATADNTFQAIYFPLGNSNV
jgi:hypothetical protein